MGTLIPRVAHAFRHDGNSLTIDRYLIFVCGGPVGARQKSLRQQFLNYANTELGKFRIFLAEAAASDIFSAGPPYFLNLARFEESLASYADCVLLFPESAGSFAEIGFFSAYAEIRGKLLVANDITLQASDSFINNGPLSLVNDHSDFRPVIHLKKSRNKVDFSPVKQRLLQRFPASRRSRFIFSNYGKLSPVAKIAVIMEVVNIFSPISLEDLYFVITSIFGDTSGDDKTLSLIRSRGSVSRPSWWQPIYAPQYRAISFRITQSYRNTKDPDIHSCFVPTTFLLPVRIYVWEKSMNILDRISAECGIPVEQLSLIVRTANHRYKTYTIPKAKEGVRLIEHPARELKFLQRWLVSNVFAYAPVHTAATAYQAHTSSVKNARVHAQSDYFLKLDFQNFFGSITRVDLFNLLIATSKNLPYSISAEDMETISKITTRQGKLIMGAPSSPAISNAVMFQFDTAMSKLALEMAIIPLTKHR